MRRNAGPKPYRSKTFDYSRDYKSLNLRDQPELYRVGRSEQGVLLVEPYKSEILPLWRFRTPAEALRSAQAITRLFREYRKAGDFVGMDMARKFLQMGYTRARRYANHKSGRKYSWEGKVLPFRNDRVKAESARIFFGYWKRAEADRIYAARKKEWKEKIG